MNLRYRGKKILIMGLGLNEGGAGTVRFFLRAGAIVTVTDLKSRRELASTIRDLERFRKKNKIRRAITYVLGRHRMKDFENHDAVIQGPGVLFSSPYLTHAQKKGIPVDTDIGIFFKNCPSSIIGVTGSKGKSTTSALLARMLRQKFRDVVLAGNIGVSPLDFLDRLNSKTKVVLELSSWQIEGLARHKASPPIAAITNILPEHLNRYGNIRAYARAKALIFAYQKKNDLLFISNQAAGILKNELKKSLSRIYRVKKNTRGLRAHGIAAEYMVDNASIALAIARACGVSLRQAYRGIQSFHGLPGRQEKIAEINGVAYYNDTTATMPDAAIAALRAIHPKKGGKIILIAGGADKKLDFSAFAREIARRVGVLMLFEGNATVKLCHELSRVGFLKTHPSALYRYSGMSRAVQQAFACACPGDVVLLSPGAASFGMFQNEFDRGGRFVKEVLKLKRFKNKDLRFKNS